MQFSLYSADGNNSSDLSYFYGINRTRRPKRGEFYKMRNMSSGEYPCISPRGKRKSVITAPAEIDAVCAPDSTNVTDITGFTGVSDGGFYYNGKKKSGKYVLSHSYSWEIIRIGNLYIINGFKRGDTKESYRAVMYYYNIDTDVFGVSNTVMEDLIVSAGVDSTGSYLATFRYGFDAVKEYVATSDDGTEIKNSDFFYTYANGGRILPASNIFEKNFSVGDEVSISGFPTADENFGQVWSYDTSDAEVDPQPNQDFSVNNTVDPDAYVSLSELEDNVILNATVSGFDTATLSVSGTQVYIHKIYFKLYNKNNEEITFDKMQGTIDYYCSGVTVEKRTRRFDNIALHNGRIWGTVPTGNMIYASSSDDIFSFSAEDIRLKFAARITSDTPGAFTAMCEYNNELILFKEDSITVIYGNRVASYSVNVLHGIGCTDKRSVQVTPEGVIFLSYGGFYMYSGGVPVCISRKLNTSYAGAVSGYDGDIYYACVDGEGGKTVLAYDTRYGAWYEWDDADVIGFFKFRDGFYIADSTNVYLTGAGDIDTDWSFTSVMLHHNTLANKALNEIWIKADVSDGAEFSVETSVDNGTFRKHASFDTAGLRIFRCPVRARMGHEFRYRISGTGKVVFYEIEFRYADGGRRYKEYGT